MTESALYVGTIRHRRRVPRSVFTHRIALLYLDLDELPDLLGGRLVRRGPGLLRVRRSDYLGSSPTPLAEAVRDRAQALTGSRPSGPIRMLAQPRSLGLCFNPVSFYYCFDADRERVQCVLAEVTSTPWGERHAYVLDQTRPGSRVIRGRFAKALHVSPFCAMDHVYEARASIPGTTCSVHIGNEQAGRPVFDATLGLRRRALTPASARWLTVRHPAATARVLVLIYGHALALKLRGARYVPHPTAALR